MKRKAILIGTNNASSDNALQGVDADMGHFVLHLRSDFGGAWEQWEIEWLPAPSINELYAKLETVQEEAPDFLVVAFSGHGFNYGDNSFVCLRNQHDFSVNDLLNRAIRQVTVIDACRVSMLGALVGRSFKTASVVGASDMLQAASYRASCRARFDARLRSIPTGQVLLQSCSVGQTSSDYPNGGLFTHSLLDLARATTSQASNWQECTKCLTVGNSFMLAKAETQRLNRYQVPTLRVQAGGAELPFAVS